MRSLLWIACAKESLADADFERALLL